MTELSKKVLAFVSRRYNPREFWVTLRILMEARINVDVVSTGPTVQSEENKKEIHRISMTVDSLKTVRSEDYAGLIVISGNPKDTEHYYTDRECIRLIREMNEQGKPLAAICAAVPSLAPAVKGKHVSWFPLTKSREILTRAGAILTEVGLTLDQNVVTAENEWMTVPWAEVFRDMLLGRAPNVPKLVPSGHRPKRIPRKDIPAVEALRKRSFQN